MAAKKTAGSRSAASKSKSNTKAKGSARSSKRAPEPVKKRLNPQIKAIILCAVGVLLLALVLIPGGSLWLTVRSFIFGLFGFCSILLPFVFFYMGIMTAKEKQMAHKGAKIALSAVIVVFLCTLIYLFGLSPNEKQRIKGLKRRFLKKR